LALGRCCCRWLEGRALQFADLDAWMPQPKAATTWAAQRFPGQEAVGEFTQTGGGSQVVELASTPQVAMENSRRAPPCSPHTATQTRAPALLTSRSQALPREATPVISSHRRTADAAPPWPLPAAGPPPPATVDPGPSPTGPVGWFLTRPAAHGSGISQRSADRRAAGRGGDECDRVSRRASSPRSCDATTASQCPAGEAGGALHVAPWLTRGLTPMGERSVQARAWRPLQTRGTTTGPPRTRRLPSRVDTEDQVRLRRGQQA
jgi:hypothetical protein